MTAAVKGTPWSADRLLADPTHMDDNHISIERSPVTGYLYAVFEATDLGGTDRDIHIARSVDGGVNWSVWEMPSYSEDEYDPDLAIDAAGYLHVVWVRDDGYIVRARSEAADNPASWAWVKGLFTDTYNAYPAIAVSGAGDFATLFIVANMLDINPGTYQWEWTLVWMSSTNSGETVAWDSLIPDGYTDLRPDVALDGATAFMVNAEHDPDSGQTRILLAADAVSGSFLDVADLSEWTTDNCGFARVAADGQSVHVVYQRDYDDGMGTIDGDIIYFNSTDGAATVNGPYAVVADEYESLGPAVYARDGIVGCLWLEAPAGADEFGLTARQSGGDGHPDLWGPLETVTDQALVEPRYHSAAGVLGEDRLHAAWIDRRDFPTAGLNVYTSDRAALPDLAPFAPDGWGGPLIISPLAGNREGGYLEADAVAYVSFACLNLGLLDAPGGFTIELLVDGRSEAAWVMDGALPVGTYVPLEDYEIVLRKGVHELEVRLDSGGVVAEMDETGNVFTLTAEWIAGEPDLAVYPPDLIFTVDEPVPAAAAAALAADPPSMRLHWLPVAAPELTTAAAAKDGTVTVVIVPAEQVDLYALGEAMGSADRGLRRKTVSDARRTVLRRVRADIDPLLDDLRSRGLCGDVRELWLAGMLSVEIEPNALATLAKHPAIGRIWLDETPSRSFGDPAAATAAAQAAAEEIQWHLAKIGADAAWAMGRDGSGVLVGHLDTGISYDHPDLADRMWDGGPEWPNHGYDAVDGDNDPYDGDTEIWHGTHTAGLVAGAFTGAAPGATLMALRAVPATFTYLVEAMQFGLDHGVDLFSMSAGWPLGTDDLRAAIRAQAEALLAAGVPLICAAGNGDNTGGHYPIPTDVSSPGDCPPPTADRPTAVLAVGATDIGDGVSALSSRGPTAWEIAAGGYDDHPYPPGLIKPDLAAPGAVVTSTVNGGYATYTGTSMATPLVAGAAAILLQEAPGLTPADLAAALTAGALDIADPGLDNLSGAGRLDIPGALAALPAARGLQFLVRNRGPLPLSVSAAVAGAEWLTVTPAGAVVAPADSARFTAVFDPTGMPAGIHQAAIVLTSNDPDSPLTMPAYMSIGVVTGIADPTPSAPAPGLRNHPNPFNPRTTLRFDLAASGRARVAIFDLRGRRVALLLDAELGAGEHELVWDGKDDAGRTVASGTYLARLVRPGGDATTGKITLAR